LILAHECAESLPNISPCRIVWLMVKIVVDGLSELVIFIP
jgi:hypothetical protein